MHFQFCILKDMFDLSDTLFIALEKNTHIL